MLPACVSAVTESPKASRVPGPFLRDSYYLEILIPARNEARRLPKTLTHTVSYLEHQPYSSSIVIIDNGSVDHTADLAAQVRSERVPIHLTRCTQRGKGAAVRCGFLTSRARFVGYMDADLATPIETLDVVEPMLREWQAVVGSRRIGEAKLAVRQPVHREFAGMIFRAMVHQILPGLADTQCGFKFFAGDLARRVALNLRVDGFAFDVELLRAIVEMGVPVKEIPVVWSDEPGSTLRPFSDGARTMVDLLSMARSKRANAWK